MSKISSKTKTKTKTKTSENNNKPTDIGILDPEGKYDNPLTGKPYQNLYKDKKWELDGETVSKTYANMGKVWSKLKVYENKDKLINSITKGQVILATASTGVGKTVLIPKLALHALDYKKKVIVCLPKRIIVREASEFAAQTLDVVLGEEVGYYYKGEQMINKNNKTSMLIFTTIGSIISIMTGNDPTLSDYGCLIIDEAHETTVENTLTLLLMKKAVQQRNDLKFVIMSATINLDMFRNYFPNPEYNFVEVDAGNIGPTYKITPYWNASKPLDWHSIATEIAFKLLKSTETGDIVIFGTSGGDANRICTSLKQQIDRYNKFKNDNKTTIVPYCDKLASGITSEERTLATNAYAYLKITNDKGRTYNRKVIVSTNVGESSITISNVKYVIDSGLQFEDSFDAETMVRYLVETDISQSSIKQRKGRTGRTGPGSVFHLYSKNDYENRREFPTPEIQKSDITDTLLNLIRMKTIKNIKDLRNLLDEFISPPSKNIVDASLRTLHGLKLISNTSDIGILTPLGEAVVQFRAIKPQFARAIIYSHSYKCSHEVIELLSIVNSADGRIDQIFIPFKPDKSKKPEVNKKAEKEYYRIRKQFEHPLGDYMSCYMAYQAFLKKRNDGIRGSKDDDEDISDAEDISGVEDIENEGIILEGEDDETDIVEKPKYDKSKKQLKKWCKDNHISFKILDRISKEIKQIKMTLKKVIRSRLLANIKIPPYYEDDLDNKIIGTIAIGAITNIARLTDGDVYVGCFPLNGKKGRFDRNTLINKPSQYVLFDELFSNSKNTKYVKLNMVSSIPESAIKVLKANNELGVCNKPEFNEYKKKKTFKLDKPKNKKRKTLKKAIGKIKRF